MAAPPELPAQRTDDSVLAPLPPGQGVKARRRVAIRAPRIVACHECDCMLSVPPLKHRAVARCPRCKAVLRRGGHRTVERTVALSIAALLLFVAANVFPILSLKIQGSFTDATILSGVRVLWDQDTPGLAALVLLTTFIAPLAQLSLMLYVLVPLGINRRAPLSVAIFRTIGHVKIWSMAEVFVLGILVALVKLADMAEIVPGIALWALGCLIPVLTASVMTLDPEEVWDRIDRSRPLEELL